MSIRRHDRWLVRAEPLGAAAVLLVPLLRYAGGSLVCGLSSGQRRSVWGSPWLRGLVGGAAGTSRFT
jgi:hypothetical protein